MATKFSCGNRNNRLGDDRIWQQTQDNDTISSIRISLYLCSRRYLLASLPGRCATLKAGREGLGLRLMFNTYNILLSIHLHEVEGHHHRHQEEAEHSQRPLLHSVIINVVKITESNNKSGNLLIFAADRQIQTKTHDDNTVALSPGSSIFSAHSTEKLGGAWGRGH